MIPETGEAVEFKDAMLEHCSFRGAVGEVYLITNCFSLNGEWKVTEVRGGKTVMRHAIQGVYMNVDEQDWIYLESCGCKWVRMEYDP